MNHPEQLQEQIEQHRFFVELDDRLRSLVDADQIALTAATLLGRYLRVSRCVYANIGDDANHVNVAGNYVDGVADITGRYEMASFGAEFVRCCKSGEPWVMDDAESDPRLDDVRDSYRAIDARAGICVPLLKDGQFAACMAVHQATPRAWTPFDIALLEGVASRCWESIERSRITRELRASEARWRTITNAMPQIVWTTSAEGVVEYWNERMYEYVGIAQGSHDGAAWAELVHPDDRAAAARTWMASIASGDAYEIAYRIRHHSGEWRWTLARALPVRDDAGNIVKWLGTNTDIDAQKRSEQALTDANRRKDEFLAMLSHELRNPLAPIGAAADLLLAGGPANEERVQRAGTIIRRQVRHLTSLVDDLLDAARVTQGLVALHTERLDLQQVVADAAEQIRPLVAERGHALALHLPPQPIHVLGDHKRMVQVLVNLLGNAAKYTPHGGRIDVELGLEAGNVRLAVRDNGVGMTTELVASAFDLFHQAERTKDRGQGGLGIGLALVKSLVEQHGGRVAATSTGPGQGSTFTVHLPHVPGPGATPAATPPASHRSHARRILVVDDNADAAQMVAMLLEVLGHDVAIEYDPLQALASVRERPFDAYILDIGLPGMDGHELARQIHQLPGAGEALFIALTGYGQEQDRRASRAAGFHHHFVKPADVDALARVLS